MQHYVFHVLSCPKDRASKTPFEVETGILSAVRKSEYTDKIGYSPSYNLFYLHLHSN